MSRTSGPLLDVPVGYRIEDWELTGPIGAGGWGSVYAARAVADGTPVAVKLLRTDVLAPGQRASLDELVRQEVRFSQEADHPNLVRTHAVCTVSDPDRPELDGAIALVMDRAERSLQDLLDATEPGEPVPNAARVLRGVAAGLMHMHAAGWVHGDLKPANILLTAHGDVWLADFGLTVELEGTHAHMPPLGTLDHLPPEWWSQRTDARGTVVRPTADIWAFGVLAHQLLTGGLHPFMGATARARALAAQSYARGTAPLRLDDRIPEAWRELITDCLAPDHNSRAPHDAAAVAARIRPLSNDARRGRRVVLPAVVAALMAVCAAVAATLLPGDDDNTGSQRDRSSPSAASSSSVPVAAGAIPADSDIPTALREPITRAANRCTEEEITPVVIAALLKAESGFDADAARPETDEYGIAMWTPSVFRAWAVDGDSDGDKDYMSPPDAIVSMGGYVCWLGQRFKQEGLKKDLPALVAAGYRTSDRTIIETGGVPERILPHVEKVRGYLAEYSG
ncbi:serine/threonine-protein kinase [Streptomyces sp. NPDC093544]|uniref:serine/threonine-protein kinase n=1 Tax=Streptomyces sp. NPDC093544 TaxID=3155200 RepID=UPI00342E99DB